MSRAALERVAGARSGRVLLLVNRHARSGTAAIDDALAVLADAGLDVEELDCDEKRPIPEAIRQRAQDYGAVIVGGGDGTLNAAAPALAETGVTLGILPLGTANDLARTLGIGADPVAAARIIAAGHTCRIDLGEVNGRLFFNVASIGFSAELAGDLTSATKRRWGKLGYGVTAVRQLIRARPFTAEIEHDGRVERVRTIQIAVGNGRHYGGGMTVEKDARPDDGLLDVYSIELRHWWQLPALLPDLRRGTQGRWQRVRAFSSTELTVRTKRPRRVNTDGELTTSTPARFRVRPGAVRVFAPRPDAPP